MPTSLPPWSCTAPPPRRVRRRPSDLARRLGDARLVIEALKESSISHRVTLITDDTGKYGKGEIKAEFDTSSPDLLDRYLLAKTHELVSEFANALDTYDFPAACSRVRRGAHWQSTSVPGPPPGRTMASKGRSSRFSTRRCGSSAVEM